MKCVFPICVFVFVVMLTVAATPAAASTITFEAPTYTAGSSINGVDGWYDYFGGSGANQMRVTPISGGETRALDGNQSLVISRKTTDVNTAFAARPWDAGTAFADGTAISWDFMLDGTTGGRADMFASQQLSSLKNFCGVEATVGGDFVMFPNGAIGATAQSYDSGVAVISDHEYRMSMVLNFTAQTYQTFYTDVTAGGNKTSLGTCALYNSVAGSGGTVTPAQAAAGGWVLAARGSSTANGIGIFDNFRVTPAPEPCTLTLLATGLIGLVAYAWRKRK